MRALAPTLAFVVACAPSRPPEQADFDALTADATFACVCGDHVARDAFDERMVELITFDSGGGFYQADGEGGWFREVDMAADKETLQVALHLGRDVQLGEPCVSAEVGGGAPPPLTSWGMTSGLVRISLTPTGDTFEQSVRLTRARFRVDDTLTSRSQLPIGPEPAPVDFTEIVLPPATVEDGVVGCPQGASPVDE